MRRESGVPDRPARSRSADVALADGVFEKVHVALVDLATVIPRIEPPGPTGQSSYARVASYVRWSGTPVGVAWTDLGDRPLDAETHAASIWSQLRQELAVLAADHGTEVVDLPITGLGELPVPAPTQRYSPHVTVIIATRDRPELLSRCLQSVLALDYQPFDVLVVDNAPSTDATRRLVATDYADAPVSLVREDRPGLATAHNRGIREAAGEIVAFTDDDVVVDPYWLSSMVDAFESDSTVSCVTGMILPLELETRAQWWLEGYAGFSKGFTPKRYNLDAQRPEDRLFPYTAGRLGSGANMAFRKDALLEIGGFDPALGTGSGSYGGDDLAAFFEIVSNGGTLAYQPGAIVHHQHPATEAQLERQVFGYGAGLTAYLTHAVVTRPSRVFTLLGKVPYAVWYALSSRSDRNSRRPADFPRSLRLRELAGMAIGPAAYLATRVRNRRREAH